MKHSTSHTAVLLLLLLTLLSGCSKRSSSSSLFGASGAPLSLAVVVPDSLDSPALRDSIRSAFGQPVQILPQREPMQDVLFTTHTHFTSMFRSLRNILYVTIDHTMYSRSSVGVSRDDYAAGQIILHAKSESVESFYRLLRQRGALLSQMIYDEEIARWGALLQQTYSSPMARMIEDSIHHVTINAPVELKYLHGRKDFVWASNMDQNKRIDMVVYTFPYRDKHTFSLDYLVHKRDSVLGAHIEGAHPGSYMTTEKRLRPLFRAKTLKGAYVAEVRGLWSMENDMMGGPFVMHAVLDGQNNRVVVAEAFVYAPGDKKRNLLLSAESALYTLRPAGSDFYTHQHSSAAKAVREPIQSPLPSRIHCIPADTPSADRIVASGLHSQ